MRIALVGLPESGKTTLFRLLTAAGPGSLRPHEDRLGVTRVSDERLDRLSVLFTPKKTTPIAHEVIDPAAPFPDAGSREAKESKADRDADTGLRSADLLLVVLRTFSDPAVPHPAGSIDPERDRARIEEEMVLSDLVLVDARLERIGKLEKVGKKSEAPGEKALLHRLHAHLESGQAIRELELGREEAKAVKGFGFLSRKPLLLVYNTGDAELPAGMLPAPAPGRASIWIAARSEAEISELPAEEREDFRSALGLGEPGLARLILAAQEVLGLVTFFTAGPPEVRAWQVPAGSNAVEAAGKIHTDLARGFIRCEAVPWDRLLEAGSWAGARERGWMRTEGREYAVREGDVLHVLFKV